MEKMSFLGMGAAGYHAIHAVRHVISRDDSFIAILVQSFVSAKTANCFKQRWIFYDQNESPY